MATRNPSECMLSRDYSPDKLLEIAEGYESQTNGLRGQPGRDKRAAKRFPLELELQYRTGSRMREAIWGRTINISSSGMLIDTEVKPARGSRLSLVVSWPAMLDNRVPLRLFVEGRVVRTEQRGVAIVFRNVEFRTAGVGRG